ncbi:sigma-54-dependent transcriptional regulator [Geobacter sulfurreducens]|uniref:sigma-54-dependent transcriptional regulator n=1 Tax=Geobacter sulfurreducens TaxID=35554 RepID=UPI000DBB3575|nr:sigma-54 dependent transcriptional regulator [Geobacter sulfurreducens]BBA70153.1 Transcriptional regulatory protein ZraR [Geobacter sulfurreducens]
MGTKLLVLDDDSVVLEQLKKVFGAEGYEVFTVSQDREAYRIIAAEHPNVAIIDLNLEGASGLDVLREAKRLDHALAVIITTGSRATRNAIEAMRQGAYDYIIKPFNLPALTETVRKAVECNLMTRTVRFTGGGGGIDDDVDYEDVMIGSSPEMLEVWKMVGRVADSDASVLIQGESGTGKELLARAIYHYSRRRHRPFLAVNCAALPETLLESELFGHEKGAFTDAHSRRIGKFEQCNGGTIFLDEVAEMSLANQGKLLRVLENQEFERVGGNETVRVDVRVLTATNRSLVQAVKEKAFRLDLLYRLRVVSFYLPPLRERVEDVPLLTDLFIKTFSRKHGKKIKGIAPRALEMLKAGYWEGNIRELKNVINSATVLCKGDFLMPEDFAPLLPAAVLPRKVEGGVGDDYFGFFRKVLEPEFDTLCRKSKGAVFETVSSSLQGALIRLALERCGNNQVVAARLLGISRNTLRDRLARSEG